MNLDDKISFFSGSTFTLAMTAPAYEMTMAIVLGILGGFAGMVGKYLFYKVREQWLKLNK